MVSQTNENALETCIETALAGIHREMLDTSGHRSGQVAQIEAAYQTAVGHGYQLGWSSDFDQAFALDTAKFWAFLQQTQAQQLEELQQQEPASWQRLILERLDRKLKKDGIVKVLKNGLQVNNTDLTLLYSAPYNTIDENVEALFEQNIFSVTRQLHYSKTAPLLSVDMVLFINGLPIATLELKNAWTGQSVYHAKKQYREDRDPKEPLFQFARCLVHFAVDTDDVYMTTRLAGANTSFLPFNKGDNHGKGNPVNGNGHKTAYLWEEVLNRYSLTNIVEHFAKVMGKKDKDPLSKKTLFFPRYHQLEVVRLALEKVIDDGVGETYLVQHSAGSGKSNSITWLAYQLIELYQQEQPVFDSVIVVTDRRVLDKQLRNNIKQFSEVSNIVAPAWNSSELKTALETNKKIIITTIQKFPFIVEGIDDLSDKKFAVIIDEAHSSQSGSAADNLNKTLGADETAGGDGPDEVQDKILAAMKRRKMRHNASYFAFTATPKNATLERFGEAQAPDAEGKVGYKPFHLYSMKQAIEEGFILDVLANYTTYNSYYEIEKSIQENPLFDHAKAQKKLRVYVEGHKETIAVKADIMVSHFLEQVVAPKKLQGKAKAMVVTQNIPAAVRYYLAITQALKKANSPVKAICAFSGSKVVDGIEYTEESINTFPPRQHKDDPNSLEAHFDTDDYRILVVANKFLTGFDQPKLSTMYVDKKLQGVLAVQALSRLNRCNILLNKRTEDMFVLDFFNETEHIKKAFDPFYTATSLSEATDVNMLHDVKDALDDVGVYDWHEVADFNRLYFNNAPATTLSPIVDTCARRFDKELDLEDDEKIDFKIKAKQFVKVYAQLACIMPFENPVWEQLHWFLKFLIPKLKVIDKEREAIDGLLDSIDLSTYGLARTKLNVAIGLDASDAEVDPQNPNVRGAHSSSHEESTLDEIVRNFNENFAAEWEASDKEKGIKIVNIVQNVADNPRYKTQVLENADVQNSDIALQKLIKEAVSRERRKEVNLYKLYANDPDFERSLNASIKRLLEQEEPQGTVKRFDHNNGHEENLFNFSIDETRHLEGISSDDELTFLENINQSLGAEAGITDSELVSLDLLSEEREELIRDPRHVPLWFGTNRKPQHQEGKLLGFGEEWQPETTYGQCIVNVPEGHVPGTTGSSWWIRLIKGDDRLSLLEVNDLQSDNYWQQLLDTLNDEPENPESLFFIHGYKTSFEEAAIRAAQLSYDLRISPAVFFSWPSKGSVQAYSADEATIEASVDAINDFLYQLDTVVSAASGTINIIAHSMGNRAILKALEFIVAKYAQPTDSVSSITNIAFAAPDVDARVFNQSMDKIQSLSAKKTLYVSEKDKAIWLSKTLHDYQRAGLVPPVTVIEGLDTIEASGVDDSFLGHSYVGSARALLTDLSSLFKAGLNPKDRVGLEKALTDKNESYWRIL